MNRRIFLAASLALGCAGCVQFIALPLDPARNAANLTGRSLGSRTWTLRALVEEAV